MPVYTRDELIALRSGDVIPTRLVRKAIFRHHLWLPGPDRKQSWWKAQRSLHRETVRLSVQSSVDSRDTLLSSNSHRSKHCKSISSVKFGLLNAHSVGNSSTAIAATVSEGQYDVFLLTETCHDTSEDVALRRCVPDGYISLDVPRPTTRVDKQNYGGVAAIISDDLDFRRISMPFKSKTFESLAFTLGSHDSTVAVLAIYSYRPGSDNVTNEFFTELEACLEIFALYKCQIVIAGDLNVDRKSVV
jgi:hypothetical protein